MHAPANVLGGVGHAAQVAGEAGNAEGALVLTVQRTIAGPSARRRSMAVDAASTSAATKSSHRRCFSYVITEILVRAPLARIFQ
jgi:hypothetical protein